MDSSSSSSSSAVCEIQENDTERIVRLLNRKIKTCNKYKSPSSGKKFIKNTQEVSSTIINGVDFAYPMAQAMVIKSVDDMKRFEHLSMLEKNNKLTK